MRLTPRYCSGNFAIAPLKFRHRNTSANIPAPPRPTPSGTTTTAPIPSRCLPPSLTRHRCRCLISPPGSLPALQNLPRQHHSASTFRRWWCGECRTLSACPACWRACTTMSPMPRWSGSMMPATARCNRIQRWSIARSAISYGSSVVSCAPSSATKIAISSAGSVVLALAETMCFVPGGSKKDWPTLKVSTGPLLSCERISPLVT